MPIDFDSTVLVAGQDAFGVALTVTPLASMPNTSPYAARGIWQSRPVIIETRAGYHSDNEPETLSIHGCLREFPARPKAKDLLTISDSSLPGLPSINWTIIDVKLDGQGKAELKLKRQPGRLSWASIMTMIENVALRLCGKTSQQIYRIYLLQALFILYMHARR